MDTGSEDQAGGEAGMLAALGRPDCAGLSNFRRGSMLVHSGGHGREKNLCVSGE